MTLLARDEEDILDAHLSFHRAAGVDLVLAIDNDSADSTPDILAAHARDGFVDVTQESGDLRQADWVTKLARRAATEFGADWVINADADEFYWPRGGNLRDVFAAVPSRYGGVRGMLRNFAPRPESGESFAERMIVRVCNPGAEDNSPYSPRFKAMHRGAPDVEVLPGSNRVLGSGVAPLPGGYPIDVLHFPIRSLEHFTAKYLRWWTLLGTRFSEAVHGAHSRGALPEFYESYVVDDEALARGVADGRLAVDTRLRDAVRSLRVDPSTALAFSDTVDAEYLAEVARLEDSEPHAHVQRKAEDLETRLAALEQSRIRALMRRFA